jgi:medium-chain acyl-[acyl-carrier-protein] hydrolase
MSEAGDHTKIWSEAVRIRSYDVDFKKQATAEAVCRFFLEAAWNHAEALGVGYSHLAQQNRFWVLARLWIQVDRAMLWGEELRLDTWPRPAKSAFAMREFEIVDGDGVQRAGGSSAWLVLDAGTRKPQRVDKLLERFQDLPQRLAIGSEPCRLDGPLDCPNGPAAKIQYSDIDVNRHTNSARYIAWVLNAYPLAFHERHGLRSLELNYVSETTAGSEVCVRSVESAPAEWLHSIVTPTGTEVCRARARWTKAAA